MKRKFTFLIAAAFMLLTMMATTGTMWGQSTVTYTVASKTSVTTTGTAPTGSSATYSQTYNNTMCQMTAGNSMTLTLSGYEGKIITGITLSMKSNSSKGAGSLSFTAGTTTLASIADAAFNTSSWYGSWSTTYVDVTPVMSNDSYEIQENENVVVSITASQNSLYCQSFTLTYEDAGASSLLDNDLALTDAPIALEFDLYNNNTAQVINYTTSSSGEVTIADNQYVETVIDEENETITVTPLLVTPSAQTITVNQATDGIYKAGSATFTVSITDNTPFAGGDVTFVAGTDVGSSTGQYHDEITKSGVTVSSTSAALASQQYRFYKNSVTTISTTSGKITKIVFTHCDNSYPVSNLSNLTDGTWIGEAESVQFTASAQARASQIVVTVTAPTSDPYITAANVDIDYDATGGNIEFTVNNEVTGGVISASTSDSWITLGSETTSPITFTCDANTEGTARTAEVTLTYTYNTTETVSKEVTITQAAAPVVYSTIPALFEAATTTEVDVNVTFNNWVISAVKNSNAYLTDNAGNGLIIYASGHGFQVNDVLSGTASCKLKKYNGSAELINLTATTDGLTVTANGTVNEQNIAIASLTGVNTGALLHYDNLTYNGTALVDGDNNAITPYSTLYSYSFESGKSYNVTGIYLQYNTTKEILPRSADDIEEIVPTEPTITVANATVNVDAEGGEGTLTVTYENITDVAAEVWFCNAAGTETALYGWITAEIDNQTNHVEYLVGPNDSDERIAYFKVWAYDDDLNAVYSNLVTVTQAEYVAPTYAELPFAFDGGKNDIEDIDGLTQEGLGGDYGSSPKLKFDSTGDWLLLQFSERPGTLTFDIKGNGYSSGSTSTFKVQTSADGTTYTDLVTYTELGDTQNESFDNLDENVRYIKWIYTEKGATSGGNVGLGNIALAEYVEPVASITVTPNLVEATIEETEGYLGITYVALDITQADDFGIQFYDVNNQELNGDDEPDWIQAAPATQSGEEGYFVYYIIEENSGAERTAYFKVWALEDTEPVYSNLVTISQAAPVVLPPVINAEDIEIEFDATSGEIAYTITNPTTATLSANSTDEWITDITIEAEKVSFSTTVNEGDTDRIGTITLSYEGAEDKVVTVTQGHQVVDYATLPFEWAGGASADLLALNGVTAYDLGTDYASNNAPYLIKFDGTGDYIQVKTNEQPGVVTIGVKMIGGASTSTLTVQGSSDGETFTDVEALTISGSQNTELTLETTNNFVATDRYVRLLFTKGSNVGVGPITIAQVDLTPSITVAPASLNLNCDGGDGELTVTHKNLADDPQLNVIFVESDGETITTCDWIQASINTAGNVAGHINANTGEARTAYLKVTGRDAENNLIKSNLVTFNQAAYTEPSIVFETTTLDIVAGGENRTMSFDYEGFGQDPTFSINFYESDGTTTATYDWIEAEITQDDKVDITVSANEGAARSAYFKVSGVNGEVNALSNLVTINQAAFVQLATYSLVTNVNQIVSGKHYLIASGSEDGTAYAIGNQNENNRSGVAVTIDNSQITETEGVYEFVINTHLNNNDEVEYYTIYDAVTPGYLYAASSSKNYLKTSTTLDDNGKWTIAINNNGATITAQGTNSRKLMRYNPNNNSPIFACYAEGSTTGNAPCLYVKDNDNDYEYYGMEITYNEPNIPDGETLTVGAGSVMTVPDNFVNDYPEALVIQEGGQLIHTNPDGVNATLQKVVEAYTPANRSGDGWYMIATPVDNLPKTAVASTSDFDLFLYNEPNAMWYAHWDNPGFETLYRGKGYLYANAADVDLNYAGLMKATDAEFSVPLSYECDDPDMKGFNLVGNPFTRNLKLGDMQLGGATLTQFYVVNPEHTGLVTIHNIDYEIKPGEGFFVQATEESQTLEFNPSTKGLEDIRFIKIVAGNENGYDNAYINIGCGNTLRKTNIANLTSVYVMDQGLDYAATRVEELAGNMPVHFAPSEDGFFTITVEAKNIENINFMHLIDNIENTAINLLAEPTYTFKAGTSDNEDRFTLVFDFNNYLDVNENNVNDSFVYQSGDELILNGEGTLQVFDMMGRFVMSKEISGSERISTSTFETGVYVLRFVGETVMTQKIVIE